MTTFFLAPAYLIAAWPYAGVVIAAVLIALQAGLTAKAARGFNIGFFREPMVFAGLLWLIYGFYERQAAVLSPGSNSGLSLGNRFDLIILVPILYAMSAMALYSLYQQTKSALPRK